MTSQHAIALILIPLVLIGCRRSAPAVAPPPPPPPPAQPFPAPQRQYYDNAGGITDSLRMVIRDTEAFRGIWTRATSRQTSPPTAPILDFSNDMIVVVGAGRMTPEDHIRVDSAYVKRIMNADGRSEEVLVIRVTTTTGCGRIRVDAYPLEISRLRRFSGRVEFEDRRLRAANCGGPPAPMQRISAIPERGRGG
jgi:hypothetical protein